MEFGVLFVVCACCVVTIAQGDIPLNSGKYFFLLFLYIFC
jgi:hypothetical protein